MRKILLVAFLIGMAAECQSNCYSMVSEYGKFGCYYQYHGRFLKLDEYYKDKNTCMRCHCREGGLLECCSENVVIKEAPPGCKIKHNGCNDIAVHRLNPKLICTQGITAILL